MAAPNRPHLGPRRSVLSAAVNKRRLLLSAVVVLLAIFVSAFAPVRHDHGSQRFTSAPRQLSVEQMDRIPSRITTYP
jgi:hypothetical protein